MDPIGMTVAGAFIALVVGALVLTHIRNNKIRNNGIEAEGYISRIEEEESIDSDGFSQMTYTYYVTYRTMEGRTVEAQLGIIIQRHYSEGEKINIMYTPEKPDYVVPAK